MASIKKQTFIAEVKLQSPFGFKSAFSWDQLFTRANQHGDMLSIHTDPRWGGSIELLKQACLNTKLPVLAKGIHASDEEIRRALEAGASKVLVVGRLPAVDLQSFCFVEPLNLTQLKDFSPHSQHIVWNSRDLKTGDVKTEGFAAARSLHSHWLCQASNIEAPSDVEPTADSFIVGENLIDFCELL